MTTKIKRQRCEVYSRVTGYLRPVENWNDAKQEEYRDREEFKLDETNKREHKLEAKSSNKKEDTPSVEMAYALRDVS